MEKKKRTPLIALVLLLVVGVVGVTIAYFTNERSFDNLFHAEDFSTTFTETFDSPQNWTPGTTTPKTVQVTNTGDVVVAVRASIESQTWVNANGNALGLEQEQENDTMVPAAIINYTANSGWTKVGDYWYYNDALKKGESTAKSFIESVKFNEKIKASQNCVESADKKTVTCTSTGDGYDGATYTLKIKVETAQYENYKAAWGLAEDSVTINPAA